MNHTEALKKINDILDQTDIRSSSTDNNGIEYDENGFSAMTEHGGVRIKVVDGMIDSWINSGDEVKKKVGEEQDRFYVWKHDNIDYLPMLENQIISNNNRLFGVGPMVDDFYNMRGYYYNIHQDEDVFYTPSIFELGIKGKWIRIRNRYEKRYLNDNIGIVENHAIVTDGNNANPESPNYSEFVKNIPLYVKRHMQAHEKRLRSAGTRKPR